MFTKSDAEAVLVRGMPSSDAVKVTWTVTGPVTVDGTEKFPERAGGVKTELLYDAGVACALDTAGTDRPFESTTVTVTAGVLAPPPSAPCRTFNVDSHQ